MMKIIDAYYNLNIRKGVKKYLSAQGFSINKIDKTYERFGVYLSRLKSVNYDKLLRNEDTLDSFLLNLHNIFEVKWANNIKYEEMPEFFYWYSEYLQTIVAIDPTIEIQGISQHFSYGSLKELSNFELPYIKDGKLTIIANPILITRVASILKKEDGYLNDAIDIAVIFYSDLLPNMCRNDWGQILLQIWPQKTKTSRKVTTRNIEIIYSDGTSRVFSGNEAMQEIALMIGINKLQTLKSIQHRGKSLITRSVEPTNALSYKELSDGWFLNLLGNNTDKLKTLRVLNAVCNLNLKINMTTAQQTSERKTNFKLIFN